MSSSLSINTQGEINQKRQTLMGIMKSSTVHSVWKWSFNWWLKSSRYPLIGRQCTGVGKVGGPKMRYETDPGIADVGSVEFELYV